MQKQQSHASGAELLHLTWPIFLELLLQIMVGNVDQFMVASYDQNAVGGIANANQILNIFLLVFSMISMATSILISQYRGAGKERQIHQIYTLSCVVNLALGLLIGLLLQLLSGPLFRMMNVPSAFQAAADTYIHHVGVFSFVQALYMTFTAIFRSNHQMTIGLVISCITNLVNVLGNFFLIRGFGPLPAMGVQGAAIATNLSRGIGLAAMVFLFHHRLHGRLQLRSLRPFPFTLLRQMLAIGVPAGGETFSYNITQIMVMTFINSFGVVSAMAYSYCHTITYFATLYCAAISQTVQILVGYYAGAQNDAAAKSLVRWAVRTSMCFTLCGSTLIFLFSQPLLSLFGAAEAVKQLGKTVLLMDIFRQLGRSYNLLYIRALQGAGDIRFPVTLGIVCMWTFVVGLGYVFGQVLGMGLAGIWLAMMLDEHFRGLVFHRRWKSGIWMDKARRLVQSAG